MQIAKMGLSGKGLRLLIAPFCFLLTHPRTLWMQLESLFLNLPSKGFFSPLKNGVNNTVFSNFVRGSPVSGFTIKPHLIPSHVPGVPRLFMSVTAQYPDFDRPVFCSDVGLSEPNGLTYLTELNPPPPPSLPLPSHL